MQHYERRAGRRVGAAGTGRLRTLARAELVGVGPDRAGWSRGEGSDQGDPRVNATVRYLLAGIRLALGWIFLWAFLDKAFGLGHDTTAAKSWVNGGSPTKGFLGSATTGPFAGFYHSIAGVALTDVLFMGALLAIGVALLLGVAMRLAAGAGALLTLMMWTVVLPPANNPFMDDHLVYAAVLVVLARLVPATPSVWAPSGPGSRWCDAPVG